MGGPADDGAPDATGREGGETGVRNLSASRQGGERRSRATQRVADHQRHPSGPGVHTLADVEHSLVELDFLLHQSLVTLVDLRQRYASMTHWPDTLTTDLVLRLADGRSESVGETRIRYLCWATGLPAPEANYPIMDENGREVARVDLAWPALGVFLEFDGKVKYERLLREGERASDVVVREKQREDMICRLTGWRCIRIVWADLYTRELTATRIRALFRSVAA
jgi:hypothetical protein